MPQISIPRFILPKRIYKQIIFRFLWWVIPINHLTEMGLSEIVKHAKKKSLIISIVNIFAVAWWHHWLNCCRERFHSWISQCINCYFEFSKNAQTIKLRMERQHWCWWPIWVGDGLFLYLKVAKISIQPSTSQACHQHQCCLSILSFIVWAFFENSK